MSSHLSGNFTIGEPDPIPIQFVQTPEPIAPVRTIEEQPVDAALVLRIHAQLISEINLQLMTPDKLANSRDEFRNRAYSIMRRDNLQLSGTERTQLAEHVLNCIYGYGPIQPLLDDPTVDQIMVNTHKKVKVERFGILQNSGVAFGSNEHLMNIINKIVGDIGRRVDESVPLSDARLKDGSRVNIVLPPVAVDGPQVTIRKFGKNPLRAEQLVEKQSLTPQMLQFLAAAVRTRMCILISGGTGAGKTTLLNVLSSYISEADRIVTIEDTAELILQQEDVSRLECRPANLEGKGAIDQRDLVRNVMRMSPTRIVMGEVRGAEAMDLLQVMNTGHRGTLSTLHANSPREALTRLETCILLSGIDLPQRAISQQIASTIDLVVQVTKMEDGKRRITHIAEIAGMEGEKVTMQDIYKFDVKSASRESVHGVFYASGLYPQCHNEMVKAGEKFSNDIYKFMVEV